MEISPDVRIQSTIRTGAVYYFEEETFESKELHYFVVLNSNPYQDTVLILIAASSQVEKRQNARKNLPQETLVIVSENDYPLFYKQTIFDCNSPIEKTKQTIITKLEQGVLKVCLEYMPGHIVELLIKGVLASPLVPKQSKKLLYPKA